MAAVQFHKLRLYKLCRIVVPGNPYHLAAGADGFKHEGNNLVKHTLVNVSSLVLSKLFIYGILYFLSEFLYLSTNDIPLSSLMFWLDMLLSSVIMISIAYIGLPLGLKTKSSKVTVITAVLIACFSYGNINGYTLLGNIYYYAFLVILTALLLFLSISNIETKDIL